MSLNKKLAKVEKTVTGCHMKMNDKIQDVKFNSKAACEYVKQETEKRVEQEREALRKRLGNLGDYVAVSNSARCPFLQIRPCRRVGKLARAAKAAGFPVDTEKMGVLFYHDLPQYPPGAMVNPFGNQNTQSSPVRVNFIILTAPPTMSNSTANTTATHPVSGTIHFYQSRFLAEFEAQDGEVSPKLAYVAKMWKEARRLDHITHHLLYLSPSQVRSALLATKSSTKTVREGLDDLVSQLMSVKL